VAFQPRNRTASQGESLNGSYLQSLREATSLYLEEFPLGFDGSPHLVPRFSIPCPFLNFRTFWSGGHSGIGRLGQRCPAERKPTW